MKTAIIVISEAGIALAKTLEQELPESEIFSTGTDTDCHSISNLQEAVPEIFHKFDAIIFIGAMGICIRAIAPHIEDKHKDPAVVCVDSTGRYAVSVLSGHIGGANGLTRYVASILGAEPVITTRSDRTGPRYSWQKIRLANSPGRIIGYESSDHTLCRLQTNSSITRHSRRRHNTVGTYLASSRRCILQI